MAVGHLKLIYDIKCHQTLLEEFLVAVGHKRKMFNVRHVAVQFCVQIRFVPCAGTF